MKPAPISLCQGSRPLAKCPLTQDALPSKPNPTMKLTRSLLLASLAFGFAVAGCKNYATVREVRPAFKSASPAGELVTQALKRPERSPEAQMGRFLDAAAVAGAALKKNPHDGQALTDYNFAVSRLFEVIHKSGLQPWKTPVICPGTNGNWTFSVSAEGMSGQDPSHFRILPADRYRFHGLLVQDRSVKAGLGAPMVATSVGFNPTQRDPFTAGKHAYYGITFVLNFQGRNCTAEYLDPLQTETVKFEGHVFPLAADFSAPIALALAELQPRKTEVLRMFKPEKFDATTRLARTQPYDPKKIPLLLIHGLGDSQATWAPMIAALRGDETIRKNYQIWVFSYPTGYPYPLMAAVLRQKLDAINAYYPNHKPMVVIGHSMGGMIARSLITDSGLTIWNNLFFTPPEKTKLSDQTRKILTEALIFQHRPEISRVIFMSASLRGADLATNFVGQIGARIIGAPSNLKGVGKEVSALFRPQTSGRGPTRVPNSIDLLNPQNRFLNAINAIPTVKGIPFNAVIGDRGKGGNLDHSRPQSTDGIVPYWSSHLDGAKSELIVPTGHWSNWTRPGIAEVKRILKQNVEASPE